MDKGSKITLRSGNQIPILGLGTWKLTEDTAETVRYALDIGYRLIDTSSDYGSQPGVGEAIRTSNIDRKDIYLITKVEEMDDAYERTQSNLQELGLDYIDLSLIHRPPEDGVGEDLWQGLIRAREEGLTKDIGISNYSIEQIQQLIDATGEIPVVNEIEWSPFGHSMEMLEFCKENNIIIIAYSPLTRETHLDDPVLMEIADKYQKTPEQILIRWNLQLGTIPIPKANEKQHLEENIDVFNFELSKEDMSKLHNLNENYSSLGYLPYI